MELMRDMFELWHLYRAGRLCHGTLRRKIEETIQWKFYNTLEEGQRWRHAPTETLCNSLFNRFDQPWTFTTTPGVEPTTTEPNSHCATPGHRVFVVAGANSPSAPQTPKGAASSKPSSPSSKPAANKNETSSTSSPHQSKPISTQTPPQNSSPGCECLPRAAFKISVGGLSTFNGGLSDVTANRIAVAISSRVYSHSVRSLCDLLTRHLL